MVQGRDSLSKIKHFTEIINEGLICMQPNFHFEL